MTNVQLIEIEAKSESIVTFEFISVPDFAATAVLVVIINTVK